MIECDVHCGSRWGLAGDVGRVVVEGGECCGAQDMYLTSQKFREALGACIAFVFIVHQS